MSSPFEVGATLAPGTVKACRECKTRSTFEGYTETHVQVLVEYDEAAFGIKWVLCEACRPVALLLIGFAGRWTRERVA